MHGEEMKVCKPQRNHMKEVCKSGRVLKLSFLKILNPKIKLNNLQLKKKLKKNPNKKKKISKIIKINYLEIRLINKNKKRNKKKI
jgi:hypothetical protein